MRTREQIETEFLKQSYRPESRLQLETLLDIRELLLNHSLGQENRGRTRNELLRLILKQLDK